MPNVVNKRDWLLMTLWMKSEVRAADVSVGLVDSPMIHAQPKIAEMMENTGDTVVSPRDVAETVYRATVQCSDREEHFFVPKFQYLYFVKSIDQLLGAGLTKKVARRVARL